MTRKEMRNMLGRWGNETRYIRTLEEKIAEYREELDYLYDLRSKEQNETRGNTISNPTLDSVVRIEKRVSDYKRRVESLERSIKSVLSDCEMLDSLFAKLSPVHQTIIHLKYVRFGAVRKGVWGKIARLSGYAEYSARNIERAAIDRMIQMYEERN